MSNSSSNAKKQTPSIDEMLKRTLQSDADPKDLAFFLTGQRTSSSPGHIT